MSKSSGWPELHIDQWTDTCGTVHLWTQIIGKIRTVQVPWINHSWHATLYVTPRGLTTLSMPYKQRTFQIDFDFIDHRLCIIASDGSSREFGLTPMTVAEFYSRVMTTLNEMGLSVSIHGSPNEVEPSIPFEKDTQHHAYDSDAMDRLRQALVRTETVMTKFRSLFRGKCSPVHFFWGSFDLAVTRFSGRPAPQHPGGFPNMPDWITREAYSHEVSSCGFWPGQGDKEAMFYSYAYPTPDGFADCSALPGAATFNKSLGEFVLPYAAVQQSATPDDDLLAFFQSTYEAAAETGSWDRGALEWDGPQRD